MFFFYSTLFPPADMNATTAASSRGVEPRLGVPLQSFCCIGVAVKTPPPLPHSMVTFSREAFHGCYSGLRIFFSPAFFPEVCVLMLKPTHTDMIFSIFRLITNADTAAIQNPACLFQSGLIAVTLVTVFDMRLLLPHSHLTFNTCCFNAAVICVDVSLKLVSDTEI